jgi:hypothetical protein
MPSTPTESTTGDHRSDRLALVAARGEFTLDSRAYRSFFESGIGRSEPPNLAAKKSETTQMAQIEISDFEKWGNLLKTWATGENKLRDGKSYDLPKTPHALKEQLTRAGIDGQVPDSVQFIQFITPDSKTLVIVLPTREAILEAEAKLGLGQPYPLPAFYKEAFGGANVSPSLNWEKFHAQRIGEYTINVCQ